MSVTLTTQTEVIGTARDPDGDMSGRIARLVLRAETASGKYVVISKAEAIEAAEQQLLWCKIPSDGRSVWIEAVDEDGDGTNDYVRTQPDGTKLNNLLALPLWWATKKMWIDPATGRPTTIT